MTDVFPDNVGDRGDLVPIAEPTYSIAERFVSIQGEGSHAGRPMAFIRFVGCSVGKKICHGCDTDFEAQHSWHGGGLYTPEELASWASKEDWSVPVCLTGGEPFDQDLEPLMAALQYRTIHVETSGTKPIPACFKQYDRHWICVSPKPGFQEAVLMDDRVREIKVIVPGLGTGPGWPSLEDVLRWADKGKDVFLQPRNAKHAIDPENLALVQELVMKNPQLRLSVQLHKLLRVR